MPATALDPRTALVVIDLQKGISMIPTAKPFAEILGKAVKLADAFRAKGLPVILVRVALSPDGGDALACRTEFRVQLPTTPEFFELAPELGTGDVVVTKRQPNAFYGTDLDLQLRRRKITGIVLTGISTSIGVGFTARAANERGYNVTFAADAVTDRDQASHDHEVAKIFPRLGEIDTTDAILALLSKMGA